jgi:replicative DNA helicase
MSNSRDRTPPHNDEIERAYLSCVLLDPDVLPDTFIEPPDFYIRAHQRIFEAVLALYGMELVPDLLTVKAELEKTGRLDEAGGAAYLETVAKTTPSSANVEYYAGIIKECSLRRGMLRMASELATRAYDEPFDINVIKEAAEKLLSLTR